jgi:hypothetical protein
MTRKMLSSIILFAVAFLSLHSFLPAPSGQVQAQRQVCANPTQSDLDCTAALMVGKGGFYTPTDAEGCDKLSPQGCKFFARITGIETVPDPNRPGRFLPLRNEADQIVVSLFIERPGKKGGSFDKDFVPYQNGCVGCFRLIDSGDLAGF